MLAGIFITFVDLFILVYTILITARVILSFVPELAERSFGRLVHDLTEPVLAPIRRIIPRSEMLDFSPLAAFLLMRLVQWGLHSLYPAF